MCSWCNNFTLPSSSPVPHHRARLTCPTLICGTVPSIASTPSMIPPNFSTVNKLSAAHLPARWLRAKKSQQFSSYWLRLLPPWPAHLEHIYNKTRLKENILRGLVVDITYDGSRTLQYAKKGNKIFPKVMHAGRSVVFQCNLPSKTDRTVSARHF